MPESDFTLSVQAACVEILQRLQLISTVRAHPDAKRVLGIEPKRLAEVEDLVRRMTQKVERVRQAGGNRVHIVFLGNFRAGKSSLINALGRVIDCEFGRREGTDRVGSTDNVLSLLQYGEKRMSSEEMLDKYHMAVEYFPCDKIRNVVLVDTPGVQDEPRHDQLINDYLDEVDLVVLVTPSTQVVNEADQMLLGTKFDRFTLARGIIVVTKMALECPRDGFDQRGVDEARVEGRRDEYRNHIRTRFPEYSDRLQLQFADTKSLWLVDSKSNYNIAKLAEYLFQGFGEEEQSRATRQKMMRQRLSVFAGDVAHIATPLQRSLEQAANSLNTIITQINQDAQQTITQNVESQSKTVSQLLQLSLQKEPFRRALTSFELPSSEDDRFPTSRRTMEALRTLVATRVGICEESIRGAEHSHFLRPDGVLPGLIRDANQLLNDWAEVTATGHLKALHELLGERLQPVFKEYQHQGIAAPEGILSRLLKDGAVITPTPEQTNNADQLTRAFNPTAAIKELNTNLEGYLGDLRSALLQDRADPSLADGQGYTIKIQQTLDRWKSDAIEKTGELEKPLNRVVANMPPKGLTRLLKETQEQVMENLREFASALCRQVLSSFERKQAALDRMGCAVNLAELAPVLESDLLEQLEKEIDTVTQEFLTTYAEEVTPLLAQFLGALRTFSTEIEVLTDDTYVKLKAHADECLTEVVCRAQHDALMSRTDWQEVTRLDLSRMADVRYWSTGRS